MSIALPCLRSNGFLLSGDICLRNYIPILSDRSDYHMTISLSITVNAFARWTLTSLSVNETSLPRYVNLFTNFREPPFREGMSTSWLKHKRFVSVHLEVNVSCGLLRAIQQGLNLGRYICKKHYIIWWLRQ